jgi:hypothetical protein
MYSPEAIIQNDLLVIHQDSKGSAEPSAGVPQSGQLEERATTV